MLEQSQTICNWAATPYIACNNDNVIEDIKTEDWMYNSFTVTDGHKKEWSIHGDS